MQVTHEKAHTLIQLYMDGALNAQEKNILSMHLKDCAECRIYAEELNEVESILFPLMQKQWNVRPVPLSLSVINAKRNSKMQASFILTTRTAAIGVIFLAFLFSAWQFTLSGRGTSGQLPMSVPPVPTPAVQTTSTRATQSCAEIFYVVQKNDTLESIAQRFTVSKEEILAINGLKTETVALSMKLLIPICRLTPTGTVNPTLFSTIYTPSLRPITPAPGG